VETEAQVFAEEAIQALGRKDVPLARMAIAQAFEVDRKLGSLADVVYLASWEIEENGGVSTATWNTLADAVDSPKLAALVESTRD
jgi:hypothetical protein